MEKACECDSLDMCDRCGRVVLINTRLGLCLGCRGLTRASQPPNDDLFTEDAIDPAQVDQAVVDYDASQKSPSEVKHEPVKTQWPQTVTPMSLRELATHIAHNYGKKVAFVDYDKMAEAIHKELCAYNWDAEPIGNDLWDVATDETVVSARNSLFVVIWELLHPWEDRADYASVSGGSVYEHRMNEIVRWYTILRRMAKLVPRP